MDELKFNISADPAASAMAYQSGQLDFAPINGSLTGLYGESKDLYTYLTGTIWYIDCNTKNQYLQNKNLRLVLSIGLDRFKRVKNGLKDKSRILDGFVPCNFSKSPDGLEFREINGLYFLTDPEKASAMANEYLQKAKEELKTDQITLSLIYSNSYPADQIAQFLQSQWKKLDGVHIELVGQENSANIQALNDHNFDLALTNCSPDYADPITFLIANTSRQINDGQNYASWPNEEFDRLVEAALEEADLDKRYNMLLEAERIMMSEAPLCGLFQAGGVALKNPRLEGLLSSEVGVAQHYKNLEFTEEEE